MKKLFLLFSLGVLVSDVNAQFNIPNANYVYSQNFNTLDTTATLGSSYTGVAITLTGWSIIEKGTSLMANEMYKGSDGYSNAGDTYAYGSTQSTERALGSLASGTNTPYYGVKFTNNSTGDTITKLVISYRVEQWRAGGRTSNDTTQFLYSTTASGVDSNTTGFTNVPGLNLVSVVLPSTATDLDGNASANNVMVADSFAVNLLPGNSIVLMWADSNFVGNDDGLAIDDLSITFRGVGPTSVVNPLHTVMPLTVVGSATANNISLSYSIVEAGNYNLTVCDLAGRVVYADVVTVHSGVNQTNVNANLQSGMYLIKLSNGKQTGIVKANVQ